MADNAGCTLLERLRSSGAYIEAVCAGRGVCGKCAVRVSEPPAPSEADRRLLSEEQLAEGWRLACQTPAEYEVATGPAPRNAEYDILQTYADEAPERREPQTGGARVTGGAARYGIAVDIGTTTLAFALVGLDDGRRLCGHAMMNSQRAFGADVISRIKSANEGLLGALHAYIIEDIRAGVGVLLKESGVPAEAVTRLVVAGNTTMLHILTNTPCDTLGRFPFTPVFTDERRFPYDELFGYGLPACEVTLLPGISTFVGADITAGLAYCEGVYGGKGANILLDLGTNGEMALFTGERVIAASAAAGPAFEGGNISRGTGSIPGAVCSAVYEPARGAFAVETVGGAAPVGICGSGALDVAAELAKHELIDETGRLREEYFKDGINICGDISFTQKDVRELQLAKSAVRAGLEILLLEAGFAAPYDGVGNVYLAGGFGYNINTRSARAVGLLPEGLASRVTAVGNSALGGCARALTDPDASARFGLIKARARELDLSAHPRFNALFMEYMMF
jgi:uncharacterized 2Fe-2S/4Fe-4S cluster protein (DUF4445 family)